METLLTNKQLFEWPKFGKTQFKFDRIDELMIIPSTANTNLFIYFFSKDISVFLEERLNIIALFCAIGALKVL